ncbi:MAG TPA: hypothetical protein VIN03_18390, partial [Roseateles sp.]
RALAFSVFRALTGASMRFSKGMSELWGNLYVCTVVLTLIRGSFHLRLDGHHVTKVAQDVSHRLNT